MNKLLAVAVGSALASQAPALFAAAASFHISNGQAVTTPQVLANGQSGSIDAGGSLTSSTNQAAIDVGGDTSAPIIVTNNGTVANTFAGGGSGIRDASDAVDLQINNGPSASLTSQNAGAIVINAAGTSIVLNNSGAITAGNMSSVGSAAIDLGAVTTGTNSIYNNYGPNGQSKIQATGADAVRPGVNGLVQNLGLIQSLQGAGGAITGDGINLQSNSGITILNAGTANGYGFIDGARNGIGGGPTTDVPFVVTVKNEGAPRFMGASIVGETGAGIYLSGFSDKQVAVIDNAGEIQGGGVRAVGIDVGGVVNLVNESAGYILGIRTGGGTITNDGVIEAVGAIYGVNLAGADRDAGGNPIAVQGIHADTTVNNAGHIYNFSGSAIGLTGAATDHSVTITNQSSGLIYGSGAGPTIYGGAQDITLINEGSVVHQGPGKAIDLGSGRSELDLSGGGVSGDVDGGSSGVSVLKSYGGANGSVIIGSIANFAAVIVGAGNTVFQGASTYTGQTTILAGGELTLGSNASPASITSNVSVAPGGTLNGVGAVLADIINAGSVSSGVLTVSGNVANTGSFSASRVAGNFYNGVGGNVEVTSVGGNVTNQGTFSSPTVEGSFTNHGTLLIQQMDSVGGDFLQAEDGRLVVTASASGSSNRLVIGGKATLVGGSTLVLADPGNYAPLTRYTILTADGGVSGRFDDATTTLSFLNPVLSYTSNAVELSLERNDISFASVANTPDQRATAGAVEMLGFASPVYTALAFLDAAQVPPALDQLSGQLHASTQTALLNDSRQLREAVEDHVAQSPAGIWTAGWGHWGHADGSTVDTLHSNGSGMLVGGDLTLGSASRIGVAGGVGQTSLSLDGSNASARATGTHLAVYGATQVGAVDLQAGGAYSWQDVDSTRRFGFGTYEDASYASYHARTAQAYVDAGWHIAMDDRKYLEPYIDAAHVRLRTDGFTESDSAAALDVKGDTTNQTIGSLGLRGGWKSADGIDLHASLAWRHAWGDLTPSSVNQFVASGPSFTVEGASSRHNVGAATLGLGFPLGRTTTVNVAYQGQFGGVRDQGARASLAIAL
ncbi:autotransporter outer membrane beta-barrel domain-containing protein [Pinirhizobacter soli]|uniref:autotransporter outer membrane beta-barrel domain-containing protein n=1 Tax=Pinirhizobacter soli TaxID=2786953 RepID=UPI00202A4BD9|nr:autotransporter domain-containing protein [Pinirhizobacter soli]